MYSLFLLSRYRPGKVPDIFPVLSLTYLEFGVGYFLLGRRAVVLAAGARGLVMAIGLMRVAVAAVVVMVLAVAGV
jgi:hypothetical protein